MKHQNQEPPSVGPKHAPADPAKKAEKVQSSRYEWEARPGEAEKPAPKTKAARSSLLAAVGARLKKLLALDFFDKDDDPTPSAA
jgi:hypothetical protein